MSLLLSALPLLLIGSLALAQDGEEVASREPIWKRARSAAARAIEHGDKPGTRTHLLEALRWKPGRKIEGELLELLIEHEPDDAIALLWAMRGLEHVLDAKGRGRAPDVVTDNLGALDAPARAAFLARVTSLTELGRLRDSARRAARRDPAQLLMIEWAAETARLLLSNSPALHDAFGPDIERDLRPFGAAESDLAKRVVGAVSKVARTTLAKGDYEDAIRAGRILVGLNAQGNTKGLRSDVPISLSGVGELGRSTVAKARKKLRARRGEPFTIEELEAMTEAEKAEFEDTYTEFGFPAVAVSPTGKYRIETSCGYETLLGVTDTVELHHDRLVGWFGQDPFEGRQGIVRIVPDINGLEAEGFSKWWAGGFQNGDTTGIRFAIGNIEELGHTLTHELTHRFDSAIYRGMPGWSVEGRASWTDESYGWSGDTEFVKHFAVPRRMREALYRGYKGESKLKDILNGENERYRDNYTFGYAMWIFINSWEIRGERVFEPVVEKWMLGCAKPKQPLDWFSTCFIDGKDGRPADFETFHKEWNVYLEGWWEDLPDEPMAPWVEKRYTLDQLASPGPTVYDRETWPWTLERAEPLFGQHHARDAGHLLADLGHDDDAVAAFLWSMIVDPRTPDRDQRLIEILDRLGDEDEAWLLRRRYGSAEGEAPFRKKLPQTTKLLKALTLLVDVEEGVAELDDAEQPVRSPRPLVRRALRADHDVLAARLGVEPLGSPAAQPSPPEGLSLFVPFCEPEWLAASADWAERDLVGYEERRVEGLWYFEESRGDLHIGREKPRGGTGELDRAAHRRDAFCYADTWMQGGRYRLRADVHITTSYVSGAIILGHERFDRKVSFGFSAGDHRYAIGKKEEFDGIESIHWSLGGRFERAKQLSIRSSGEHSFDRPTNSFEVELLVDDSLVMCFIDGDLKGSYRTPDGSAIEGYVGFAMSRGAVRISGACLQRLDRARSAGLLGRLPRALDLKDAEVPDFRNLVGVPVEGLPRSPNGVFAVWIPLPELNEEEDESERLELRWKQLARRTKRYVTKASKVLNKLEARIPLHLLLPTDAGAELQGRMRELAASILAEDATHAALVSLDELALREEEKLGRTLTEAEEAALKIERLPRLLEVCTRPLEVHLHAGPGEAGWTAQNPTGTDRSSFLFIDPAGVIRAQQIPTTSPNAVLSKWLRVFRSGEAPPPARRPSEEQR